MKQKLMLSGLVSLLSFITTGAQVNLQTGAAQLGIPLFSYSDPANRLSTGVSLVYTAGNGLKVSEIPSPVGAGWALECGGFIQRIQHGEPDDQKNNDSYTYPAEISNQQQGSSFYNWARHYYPNGYLYSEYSPSQLIDNTAGYNPLFGPSSNNTMGYDPNYAPSGIAYRPHQKYMADLEQDVFMFSFNGRTGYFVIGKKDQNNVHPVVTLYDSKLKIQKVDGDLNNTNGIRTTISEFQITDENGIKYIFKDADLSQVCEYNKTEYYRNDGGFDPGYGFTIDPGPPLTIPYYKVMRANARNEFTKNKWYLSEIINPLTGVKIVFEYESFPIDLQGNKISNRSVITSNNSTDRIEFNVLIERIKGVSKRLKRITLSSKEEIEFSYASMPRIDLPADRPLEKISIRYDNAVKYTWQFEQGYFVKTGIKPLYHSFNPEEKVWARLCLLKLLKTGADASAEPPYTFSYYMGNENGENSAVPPLFSFYQDAWGYYNDSRYGYYNPQTQTSSLFNPPYEPFDGKLLPKSVYEYPLTNPYTMSYNFKAPGLGGKSGIVKTINYPAGGSLTFDYEQNFFSWETVGGEFNMLGTGGVRVSKTTRSDGQNPAGDIIHDYKYTKENGETSGWGSDKHILKNSTAITVFKKCNDQKYPGMSFPQLALSFHQYWNNYSFYRHATRLAGQGTALGNNFQSPASAVISSIMWQVAFHTFVSIVIDLFSSNWKNYTSVEATSSTYSSHNLLPYQYSRVEVISKLANNDNTGKTVHEFTSPAETNPLYAIDFPNLSSPYSSKQRLAFWLYGLPKMTSYYDKNNTLVKKIENIYNPVKYFLTDPKFASQKWQPNKRTFNCFFYPGSSAASQDIDHDLYYPICGRVELVATKEYTYNHDNQHALTSTEYEYAADNYLLKKAKTTNSKGELIETNTYYPGDYTVGGAIQVMKDNNILAMPVSSQTFITKSGNQKYLLSGDVSEFGIGSDGDIKTIKTYSAKTADPVPAASVPFSAGQLIPNANYYEETGAVVYSSNGLPVQVTSEAGRVSTIYDYDNKMAVATVANADHTDIAYTSFEADGAGGWLFNPLDISTEFSPTGKKCLKAVMLHETTISRSISSARTYTLSFWLKGELPFMSGATFVLRRSYTVAATGYTYYEYEVTNGTSVTLTSRAGQGPNAVYRVFSLDEIRLYPAAARMTTATFDPFTGKTAESDANGRIVYYEYDGLGRLRLVRDENRDVLKTYNYNYKQ